MKYLSALLLCCCVLAITAQEDNARSRSARLFFVSSSSTTLTVNAVTYCYNTGNTAITAPCPGRKKRAIIDGLDDEKSRSIDPSSASIESGLEEPEEANHRQGKFLLYWLTTTSTSTTTSFTATNTITVASCTPASTTAGDLAQC